MKVNASVATAILLSAPARAATGGSFNVLSMNVAGLPAFLNGNDVPGDKATNAGLIGSKLAEYGYDLIHVQEVSRRLRTKGNPSPRDPACMKHRSRPPNSD